MGSDSAKRELLKALEEKARRKRYTLIKQMFPETGPYRRELYPKHMEFFRAGSLHRERLFMAANRVGKTVAGGCELTYHMTGDYPEWWDGARFDRAVQCLAAGDTSSTTRDIIQKKLLGGIWGTPEFGTGLIPGHTLMKPTPGRGVANLYEEKIGRAHV